MILKHALKAKLYIALVFMILGIVFSAVAVGLTINDYNKKNNWLESEAKIINIDYHDEEVRVSYSYNGIEYSCYLNSYSSIYYVGQVIDISINPDNPSQIYEHTFEIVIYIFYGIGAPLLLVGIWFLIQHVKSIKMRNLCMKTGVRKKLNVESINKTSFYYNHEPYYVLYVIYQGQLLKSQMFLLPHSFDLSSRSTVDLYYIDDKKYFIDLLSFNQKNDE